MFDMMPNFSSFIERRQLLLHKVRSAHKDARGLILLWASAEYERVRFRQESSFHYFTGVTEPSVVMTIDVETGYTTLYTPACAIDRSIWVASDMPLVQEHAGLLGVDKVTALGQPCAGYQMNTFFKAAECEFVIRALTQTIEQGGSIFTVYPSATSGYAEQRLALYHMNEYVPELKKHLVDISPLVAQMRRKKSQEEIEKLFKAVEITGLAQEAAARAIRDGATEAEVQASIEYIFIGSSSQPSFPSIVAAGKNGTVLHYTQNRGVLSSGQLVVVDIGAEFELYCADLTRTYPVSGKFSKRQHEIYMAVLDTQQYIADIAKPGMWLSNKDHAEQSLNHLAKKFMADKGYEKYFPHGIGHYLGLDVHDVGDYATPLQPGDVITIEPGIYIPEEGIGVRIEDDYWIVEDGVVCLSEDLPKEPREIEAMVREQFM